MATWKSTFIAFLIETYKIYKTEGLREPEIVLQCTRDYQQRSDVMLEFINENIEKTDDKKQVLGIMQVFQQFRQWHKENFGDVGPGRNEVNSYLVTHFAGAKSPWKGCYFKQSKTIYMSDEEEI